ncbi:hypothetical protein, partial [Bergeriella denitrificans]|uniref:hypothetical protein n=1 Tax=Bergeriella denitrificans TaxID=494 RepID=UPI001C3FC0D1
ADIFSYINESSGKSDRPTDILRYFYCFQQYMNFRRQKIARFSSLASQVRYLTITFIGKKSKKSRLKTDFQTACFSSLFLCLLGV